MARITRADVVQPTTEEIDSLDAMDPAEYEAKEKKLVRRIDLRLMPCLILMIVMKFVLHAEHACQFSPFIVISIATR